MADKKKAETVVTEPTQKPKVTDTTLPTTGKTIDERMADLLADHKRMGAR
jgi:hypothetical protein